MKKKNEKQLPLGKIKIASLSKHQQESVQGGRPPVTKTKCGMGACVNTTNCTTHYVICGC